MLHGIPAPRTCPPYLELSVMTKLASRVSKQDKRGTLDVSWEEWLLGVYVYIALACRLGV